MQILVVVLFATSCSPGRKLSEDQVFFKKYKIVVHNPPKNYKVESDDLAEIIKLKPNRNIIWNRFNAGVYSLFAPKDWDTYLSRIYDKRIHKNERRIKKEKEPREVKRRTPREYFCFTVGEPPAVLDTTLVSRSAEQMHLYLLKKGYFHNRVTPEIIYKNQGKKARINYHVDPGESWYIRNIRYMTTDSSLQSRIRLFEETSMIDSGAIFDIDLLDSERERITDFLNNRGYYDFTKEYISFDVDSTVSPGLVDIDLRIRGVRMRSDEFKDSIVEVSHTKYYVGKIFVHTDYNPLDPDYESTDTTYYSDLVLLHDSVLAVKPSLIAFTINFAQGDLYQKERVDQTYKRFSQLQIFRSASIEWIPRAKERPQDAQILDCHIKLAPALKQSVTFDPRLIHRSENLGVFSTLNYRHKNVFRGAESFEIRIGGGLEAQRTLIDETDENSTGDQVRRTFQLNTYEIGPEVSIKLPRLFPLGHDQVARTSEPSTTFSAAFNFQSRPDYARALSQLKVTWNWIENAEKGSRLYIDWWEFSIIKINKTDAFQAYLDQIEDDFLSNAYNDHLINATGVGWILNTQKSRKQKRYLLNNSSLQWAGQWPHLSRIGVQDDEGSYRIAGIRFAQYIKLEEDFRYYYNLDDKNTMVFRIDGGVGKPGGNLNVLPFEKSFFAGGSNGIRAWRARALGPGSFRDTTEISTFNALGEVKIEANMEYRFSMTRTFEGALFLDAGNIWMLDEDPSRPGSNFTSKRFLSEIAIGTGFGARLDFDFFLLRFDFGLQLKDPLKIPGERWIWEKKDEYNEYISRFNTENRQYSYSPKLTFNLGIGYPF